MDNSLPAGEPFLRQIPGENVKKKKNQRSNTVFAQGLCLLSAPEKPQDSHDK